MGIFWHIGVKIFGATLSPGFTNCHNTYFFVRSYCLRAGLFKDLMVWGAQLFEGPIVTGPDCAGPGCAGPGGAGSDSLGPDCAGPYRTCTRKGSLQIKFKLYGGVIFCQTKFNLSVLQHVILNYITVYVPCAANGAELMKQPCSLLMMVGLLVLVRGLL